MLQARPVTRRDLLRRMLLSVRHGQVLAPRGGKDSKTTWHQNQGAFHIEEAGCLSDSGTAQARDLLTGTCPVRFLTEIRSNLDAVCQRNDIAG